MRRLLVPLLAFPLLGGCLAKTAFDVATAPVRAAGQVVDWTTTSQDEADRNYGRRMRKQEAQEGRERKRWMEKCEDDGRGRDDCARAYGGYRAGDPE